MSETIQLRRRESTFAKGQKPVPRRNLKTALRKMWARFIRICIGPKRGAMHAQKQEWDLIDINK